MHNYTPSSRLPPMAHRISGDQDRMSGIDRNCRNCGGHVTPRFARVMGDNEDQVFACPDCQGFRELSEGAGAAQYSNATTSGSGTEG